MNFKKLFLDHCKNNQYEINENQLAIIDSLNNFYNENFKKSFFDKIFKKDLNYLGF